MQVQLIDDDSALHEALAIRLQSSGIELCQGDVPDANRLHQWHTTADLFVVGQHAIADSLAQLSRQIWPKPVVALLPVSDTAHNHASGARWRCRRASSISISRIDRAVAHHGMRGMGFPRKEQTCGQSLST